MCLLSGNKQSNVVLKLDFAESKTLVGRLNAKCMMNRINAIVNQKELNSYREINYILYLYSCFDKKIAVWAHTSMYCRKIVKKEQFFLIIMNL